MQTAEVVSAVIAHEGRLLMTQRRADKDFPFTWESPGGKVEELESHWGALARELKELGVTLSTIGFEPLASETFNNMVTRDDRKIVVVHLYEVLLESHTKPKPLEGQGIGWFDVRSLQWLPMAPANHAHRKLLEKVAWRSQGSRKG